LLAKPENPTEAALMDELSMDVMPVVLYPTGIIVVGSNGNWLLAAAAAEGESVLAFADASAFVLAVAPVAFVASDFVELEDFETA
jgi:hypothetical protein